MTRQFTVPNYRVRTMLEYAPEDFAFCYFLTAHLTIAISDQFGPFYYFFGVTKVPK